MIPVLLLDDINSTPIHSSKRIELIITLHLWYRQLHWYESSYQKGLIRQERMLNESHQMGILGVGKLYQMGFENSGR